MGILSSMFNTIAGGLNKFSSKIPSLNLDSSWLPSSLRVLKPYWETADRIFPMKETLIVFSILCTFAMAMFIFWTIQRLINLIRGSG